MFRWRIIKSSSARIEKRIWAARHEFILLLSGPRRNDKKMKIVYSCNELNLKRRKNPTYRSSSLKGSIRFIARRREFPSDSDAPWEGLVNSRINVIYDKDKKHDSHLTRENLFYIRKTLIWLQNYELKADGNELCEYKVFYKDLRIFVTMGP